MAFNDASNSGAVLDTTGCTAAAANMRVLFDAIKAFIPGTVTISWDGAASHLDDATGALTAVTPYTPPAVVAGTASAAYAAPVGFCLKWITSGVVNGHVLKGRTYIVPSTSGAFDATGTMGSTALSTATTAAAAFVTSSNASGSYRFVIWHRPQGGAGGESWLVGSSTVKDIAAVLRSRRD